MQSSLRVLRRKPRDRGKLEGLAGRASLAVRACSRKLGDPVDSYLHVGTGALRVRVAKHVLSRAAQARRRSELEAIVSELQRAISLEHQQFTATLRGAVIPGSSVKGNLRSRLELSFAPREGAVRACLIRASHPRPPPPVGQHGWRHHMVWEESLRPAREPSCSCTEGWEECEVCILCDLFGTAGLQGLVSFTDFVGEGVTLERVDLPYGMRLEAAPPGSVFKGSVTFRNLEPAELGLLLYGMGLRDRRLGRPVLLGRLKYRRDLPRVFGVVRYELLRLDLAPFSRPLEAGGVRAQPGAALEGGELDALVTALVGEALREFGGELLDVDEVGAVERLER